MSDDDKYPPHIRDWIYAGIALFTIAFWVGFIWLCVEAGQAIGEFITRLFN